MFRCLQYTCCFFGHPDRRYKPCCSLNQRLKYTKRKQGMHEKICRIAKEKLRQVWQHPSWVLGKEGKLISTTSSVFTPPENARFYSHKCQFVWGKYFANISPENLIYFAILFILPREGSAMEESEQVEFKKTTSEINEGMISISSILNKHKSGVLYFGLKNDGTPYKFKITCICY